MLKKLFKTFKKSKKEESYDEYYPELDSSQNNFSIKYAEVKEETKEDDTKKIKKLPIEALKDRVEEISDELNKFIEKTSKKKINFMPIFISCFIFVSLGINYYVLEYKSKSMVENSTKDLVLYEKIAMLEKNISNTPQKEDKNNYQKDIEDLRNKNKALEEAIALSTEALMKQKMEIATLVEKINIVSGGSDGVVLTKDDLTRIALMETNTFKNKEEIEKLSKLISGNGSKSNVSYREDINISNKNANVFDEKELPIFVVYKINSDKTFYIKNRANNKLYEHVIGIRNLISNRYEVLDVDLENGLVIFKDQKNGTSLSLRVNE